MRGTFALFFILTFIVGNSQKKFSEKQIDSVQNTIVTTNVANTDRIEAICTDLYYQSKELGYVKGQIAALLRRIAYKINIRNYNNVQEDLDEVVELCNKNKDFFHLAKAKAMEVTMLTHLDFHTKAERLLNENFKLISKIEDINKRRFMETYYYARYITLYVDNKDSVFHYSNKRLNTALKLPKTDRDKPLIIVSTAGYLCNYYATINDGKRFEYYLKVQEKYIKNIDNLFDLYNYHKRKAEFIYEYNKNEKSFLDSSLYHFKKAEYYAKLYKNPDFLEVLYPEIANVYEDKKELEKQKEYTKKYVKISDSIVAQENNAINKIIFNKEKVKEDTSFSYFYGLVFAILALVCLVFSISKWLKWTKKKTQKSIVLSETVKLHAETLKKIALEENVVFYHNFEEIYPDFKRKLLRINPNFTQSEIEFCALIKIQLSNKEISLSQKMSVRAVDSKKYRIRQKLNLVSGTDLYSFLAEI